MLTSKQRAFLRGLAVNEDTILMVGKGGVSPELIAQADGALNTRELIKGKALETAPGAAADFAAKIAEETRAEVVQVIGSKFVLYRRNEKKPVIELPKVRKK